MLRFCWLCRTSTFLVCAWVVGTTAARGTHEHNSLHSKPHSWILIRLFATDCIYTRAHIANQVTNQFPVSYVHFCKYRSTSGLAKSANNFVTVNHSNFIVSTLVGWPHLKNALGLFVSMLTFSSLTSAVSIHCPRLDVAELSIKPA